MLKNTNDFALIIARRVFVSKMSTVLNVNIEKYEAFKELTHDHASNSSSIEIELNNLNSNNPIVPVENADELDILIKMERANK